MAWNDPAVTRVECLAQRLAGRRVHRWQSLPFGLAVAAAFQSVWFAPAPGDSRAALAVGCALTFLAASLTHAAMWRHCRWGLLLLLAAGGGGLLIEVIGLRFGVPFSAYAYSDQLGWRLFGVPLIVPLAWTMMAYPALVAGRCISTHAVRGPLAATAALVGWDLLLDPVMVRAGWWSWHGSTVSWAGVPLINFLGWTGTAFLMLWPMWRFHPATDRTPMDDRVPLGLYAGMALWLVVQALSVGLVGVAFVGGTVMGCLTWLSLRNRGGLAGLVYAPNQAESRAWQPAAATARRTVDSARGLRMQRPAHHRQHEPQRVA